MKVYNRNYIGLLKFGTKEHLEALCEEGLLYITSLQDDETASGAS